MSSIVIFGAGSVGRGFIGQIFSQAGWQVMFIDMDRDLVSALHSGSYQHATISDEGTSLTAISHVDALLGSDLEDVVAAVASASMIATSVGAANLVHIARAVAAGLRKRHESAGGPIDILLAENLHDVDEVLRALLADALGDDAGILDEVGFLRTSIGRMIPVPSAAQRATDVSWIGAEPYRELPYDVAACKAAAPDVPDLLGRTDIPFSFYADRKLYLHNLGHALTAYLGALMGYREIAQSIADPSIRPLVEAAMTAASRSLALEYGEPLEAVEANRDDLLDRFANRALHDSVERVGRDPLRKLAPGDRFFGALGLCARHGLARPVTVAVAVGVDALLQTLADKDRDAALSQYRGQLIAAAGPDEGAAFDSALALLAGPPDLAGLLGLASS